MFESKSKFSYTFKLVPQDELWLLKQILSFWKDILMTSENYSKLFQLLSKDFQSHRLMRELYRRDPYIF